MEFTWLLFDQAKHSGGDRTFWGRVQDSPFKLTFGVDTMLLAVHDNSSEGLPHAARSAIHQAAAIPKGRRDLSRLPRRT